MVKRLKKMIRMDKHTITHHNSLTFFRQVDEGYPDFHLIFTNMGAPNMSAHLCFSYMGRTDGTVGHGKGQVVNKEFKGRKPTDN